MNKDINQKIAVLLINLGTPDKPYKKEVREYLREFLLDKDVIRLPRLIWLPILYGSILPFRSKKSAELYQKIWTERGSPLLFNTYDQSKYLQKRLDHHESNKYRVEVAMRYGNPSIESIIEKLKNDGFRKVIYIPLFPQYSTTTTLSVYKKIFKYKKIIPLFEFVPEFYSHNLYIKAIKDKIQKFQKDRGTPDKLLFSYHGIPKSYIGPNEPYEEQCYITSQLIAEQLKIEKSSHETVFQSRLGRAKWLQPYLSERLRELPGEGINNIQIFCPGFVSDCLETLEEVGQEAKEIFLESNGNQFEFISCLNSNDGFLDTLEDIVFSKSKTLDEKSS